MKNARLIYLRGKDDSDEGIVIDTGNLSNSQLEEDYGMPVHKIIELDDPAYDLPNDRLLIPE